MKALVAGATGLIGKHLVARLTARRVLARNPDARERSTPDRQLYVLGDGLLSRRSGRGRLEFRRVLDGRTLLVAIHDYSPRLPWFVYVLTQAPLHAPVMAAFRRYLAKSSRGAGASDVQLPESAA